MWSRIIFGAPDFTQGFQWGWCGTMCSFLCSVVYISEHLSLLKVFRGVGVARSVVFCVVLCISRSTSIYPRFLVGLVWHDLQFSVWCCVYLGAPEFTQGFQWGWCGTICSFICSVVYISEHLSLLKVFSGVGVARSVVFCVVLCISRST